MERRRKAESARGLQKAVVSQVAKVRDGPVLKAVKEVGPAGSQNPEVGHGLGVKLLRSRKKTLSQKS